MQANPYSSPSAALDGPSDADPYSQAITAEVISQLARTKPWVRLISVLILIGAGFMLLAALFMGFGGGAAMFAATGALGGAEVGLGIGMLLLYVAIAALYIYPGLKLWKYATRIGLLMQSNQTIDLVAALNEQRAFWKFLGIVAIVVMGLYLIIIPVMIFGIVGAASAVSN